MRPATATDLDALFRRWNRGVDLPGEWDAIVRELRRWNAGRKRL